MQTVQLFLAKNLGKGAFFNKKKILKKIILIRLDYTYQGSGLMHYKAQVQKGLQTILKKLPPMNNHKLLGHFHRITSET